MDSDEEWEEEEPGESLSHSEGVRIPPAEKQLPVTLALGRLSSDEQTFLFRMMKRKERMKMMMMAFLYPMGTYLKMKE